MPRDCIRWHGRRAVCACHRGTNKPSEVSGVPPALLRRLALWHRHRWRIRNADLHALPAIRTTSSGGRASLGRTRLHLIPMIRQGFITFKELPIRTELLLDCEESLRGRRKFSAWGSFVPIKECVILLIYINFAKNLLQETTLDSTQVTPIILNP